MTARSNRQTRQRTAPPATRRRDAAHPPSPRQRDPQGPEERELRAGGPQDRALYTCSCGATFQAEVSASVACPRCDAHQAW